MHTLLLADDEPGLSAKLERVIRKNRPNLIITSETTAAGAIRQIQEHEFDLIITDWIFAGEQLSGADVLRAARARDSHTVTIVISAFMGETVDRYRDGFDQGAYEVLDKTGPFDFVRELQCKTAGALVLRDSYLRAREMVRPDTSRSVVTGVGPVRAAYRAATEWKPEFGRERARLIGKERCEGLSGEELKELERLQKLHLDWIKTHKPQPDFTEVDGLLKKFKAKYGPLDDE